MSVCSDTFAIHYHLCILQMQLCILRCADRLPIPLCRIWCRSDFFQFHSAVLKGQLFPKKCYSFVLKCKILLIRTTIYRQVLAQIKPTCRLIRIKNDHRSICCRSHCLIKRRIGSPVNMYLRKCRNRHSRRHRSRRQTDHENLVHFLFHFRPLHVNLCRKKRRFHFFVNRRIFFIILPVLLPGVRGQGACGYLPRTEYRYKASQGLFRFGYKVLPSLPGVLRESDPPHT